MAIPFHDRRTGEILYHGTNVEFKPGDVIKPSYEAGVTRRGPIPFGPQVETTYLAHAAPDDHPGIAHMFASAAVKRQGGTAHVYEVAPVDESDVKLRGISRTSPSGFKVVKKVPHDPTDHTWRHAPVAPTRDALMGPKYLPENYGK